MPAWQAAETGGPSGPSFQVAGAGAVMTAAARAVVARIAIDFIWATVVEITK
jgi:hypothetical protein